MSFQEEKEKMQAQKEEVLSHVNDVLENELQCIICSEYFIEVIISSGSCLFVLSTARSLSYTGSALGKHSEAIFILGICCSYLTSK